MRITKVSNKWLNRAYKILAICLVIFAVLISSLRLFLPYAHNYREDLQDYINNTYGSNLNIADLAMDWQRNGPALVAKNVSVLRTDGAEIFIEKFDVNLDFWRSLRQRSFVTKDFALSGVKVLFDKQLFASNATNNSSLIDNATELFLKQINRFSINDSQVIYRDEKGEKTFLINELYWANKGNSHKAKGHIVLDGLTSNTLQINMDLKGDNIADMRGSLYLEANQLNITPWLGKMFAIEDENTHSSINFNAWLSIEQGKAQRLQLSLGDNQVAWQHDNQIKTLNIERGDIVIDNLSQPNYLQAYSNNIVVSTDQQQWQPFHFEFSRRLNRYNGYISSIDIAGVADLLPLFVEHRYAAELIEELNPQGQLAALTLEYDEKNIKATADFTQVNTSFSQGIPGVSNISGQIIVNNDIAKINVRGQDGQLDFAEHFTAPIDFDKLQANVTVLKNQGRLNISAPDVVFESAKIKLNAEFGVSAVDDKPITMSLMAKINDMNVVDAPAFYPHLLMGEDLVNYLNGALKKGRIATGQVLFNGPLAKFPFEENEGIFKVDAELVDASFIFDEHWPAIQHFAANLNFTNNSMLITGRSGTLNGLDVNGVTAAIDDLSHNQLLQVNASLAKAEPSLITNLMLTSPLDQSVGTVLEQLNVKQAVAADFSLLLPLNNVNETVAKGDIYFKDNHISLKAPAMAFSKVTGKLSFENEKVDASELALAWRDMPLTLAIVGRQQPLHYQTLITIDALWPEKAWLAQLPAPMKTYGSGALDWQGQLTLTHYNDGEFNYHLNIDSSLVGTGLTLPSPFNKQTNEILASKVIVSGDLSQSTVDLVVGEQLAFYGKLDHQQITFNQSHLILGQEPMSLPKAGLHVTSALKHASVAQWQPFISDLFDSIALHEGDATQPSILPAPEFVRGDIEHLDLYGENLTGVSFDLEDQTSWWQLSLTSKEVRGKVKIFPDWLHQGLEVDADFIRISPEKMLFGEAKDTKELIEEIKPTINNKDNLALFATIPNLRFSCGDCQYGNVNLGNVNFTVNRSGESLLKLENFVAKRKNNQIILDAAWQLKADQSRTEIVGTYNTKDIERELERLGISSTVADSGLSTSFTLNWLGGPHNFAIANLNGDIKAKLDEGVLKEVPDQARAFSILSLQSLVRKLKFDFRDIFADGMFYREIKGDYHIQQGIIYTKNTFMKGAAGDLTVKGNTDLNTRTIDYRMTYQPNVTSSLPAIAWIATLNPVTFLAGVAIDGVITSQVPVEYQFALTGDIQAPDFRQIDRKTKHISVGQDSPPQIVDTLPTTTSEPEIEGVLNPETGLIEPMKNQVPPNG